MKTKLLAWAATLLLLSTLCACSGKGEDGVIRPTLKEGTMGASLWNTFVTAAQDDPTMEADAMASKLLEDPTVTFSGGVSPVESEAEYFAGFGEYKITGYERAVMFAPMIGSIPFVGYVFDLEEGTDPQTFIASLTDNADPGWNVCVRAEQTVAGAVGRRVLFVMCPEQMQG